MVGIEGFQLVVVFLASDAGDAARVADEDARGAVETVLQVVADDAEERQPHPAGAHRARARHAVALALLTHLRRDVLRIQTKTNVSHFVEADHQ